MGHCTRCLKSNFTAPPEKLFTGENCEFDLLISHSVFLSYSRFFRGGTIQHNLIDPRGPNRPQPLTS